MLLASLALSGILPLLAPAAPPVAAQTAGPACATSGPNSGAYEAEICIAASWADADQTGDVEIAVSVDAISGILPEIFKAEFGLAKDPARTSFNVLTDFGTPYGFTLPTDQFVDGSYRVNVEVEFVDDFETPKTEISLRFRNGIAREPQVTNSWQPTPGKPGEPFVVAAVGDAAGGQPSAGAVADMIEGWNPSLFLYLGDVYNFGTYTEFYNYYEPTFGRFKEITDPVIGNHEAGSGFGGYFAYWDSYAHYYSVDTAGWHLVGIDNTVTYQQMRPGDPQYDWLAQDLAAHADDCTIVFMHYPRWGQGHYPDNQDMQPIWELLVQQDVELALAAHEHNYQRWLPMNAAGEIDPAGVPQIIAGTGGHELEPFLFHDPRVAVGLPRQAGALRMELTSTGAEFQFIDLDGAVLDSGSIPCTVPGAITLSKTKSKTEGRVEAELSHFTPNSDIMLTWDDGLILGSGRSDAEGNARINFRTPSSPYGTYAVMATDETGLSGTAWLSVIPRVKITRESIAAGADLRLYFYGFSAGKLIEIRLSGDGGATYTTLGTVTTGADGSADALVTMPAELPPKEYTVIAIPTTGERRSGSETITVTAAQAHPQATPGTGEGAMWPLNQWLARWSGTKSMTR